MKVELVRTDATLIVASCLVVIVIMCTGCGGGDSTPPLPPPAVDFTLSMSPEHLSVVSGN
jgi:hypothetical protein